MGSSLHLIHPNSIIYPDLVHKELLKHIQQSGYFEEQQWAKSEAILSIKENAMIKIIKIVVVCSWAVLLTACMQAQNRAAPDNFIEADPNSVPDTFWVQPEELGWSSGYFEYESLTVNLSPSVPMVSFSGINLSFLPRPEGKYPPPADFRAGQNVYIYSDEQTATKAFEEMKRGGELGGTIWQTLPLEDELKMDTAIGECNRGSSVASGEYLRCKVQIQHGRYVIRFSMVMDGKQVTVEDWEKMVDLIQERLVELE